MKLFVKLSTVRRRVMEAELNIIESLERMHIDAGVLDDIVEIISKEMKEIIKE